MISRRARKILDEQMDEASGFGGKIEPAAGQGPAQGKALHDGDDEKGCVGGVDVWAQGPLRLASGNGRNQLGMQGFLVFGKTCAQFGVARVQFSRKENGGKTGGGFDGSSLRDRNGDDAACCRHDGADGAGPRRGHVAAKPFRDRRPDQILSGKMPEQGRLGETDGIGDHFGGQCIGAMLVGKAKRSVDDLRLALGRRQTGGRR